MFPRLRSKGREVTSEAVVLRSRTWNEDDLLVDFLTRGEGRVLGVARHGRKSKKRFGTVLEALNVVTIRYRDKGGVTALEESSLAYPMPALAQDLDRLSSALYLVDLVRTLVPERNAESKIYDLLKESLLSLNHLQPPSHPPQGVVLSFEMRILDLTGYAPSLEKCLSCERPWSASGPFHFVFREGGIFCLDCLPPGLAHEPFSRQSLAKLLPRFIEYQLGRSLKSHKVLTQIGLSG